MRKYGRSLPLHYKYPNFAKNLDEYYPEITKALTIIRGEGYPFVILNGHSTGALTAARYLQDGTEKGVVDAAFLNSPFLDFNDRDISGFGERIARSIGKIAPHSSAEIVRATCGTPSACYSHALRARTVTAAGVFDTNLKPIDGFPVFLGWVRAIAIAQDKVRKGGIGQPILILHSARVERRRRHDLARRISAIRPRARRRRHEAGRHRRSGSR